jgi:hypothetical protein
MTPVAIGALALTVTAGPLIDSPAVWAAAILAVIGSAGISGISHVLSRRRWQLRAEYDGTPILLYSTTDSQTFGQVKRGLVRALEANRAIFQH